MRLKAYDYARMHRSHQTTDMPPPVLRRCLLTVTLLLGACARPPDTASVPEPPPAAPELLQAVLAAQIAVTTDAPTDLAAQLARLPDLIDDESDPQVFPYAIALAEQMDLHQSAIRLADRWLARQPDNPNAVLAALSLPLTPEASADELRRLADFTAEPQPEPMLMRIARQLAALPLDTLGTFTAARPENPAVWLTAGLAAWHQADFERAHAYLSGSLKRAPDWELPALYRLRYTPPPPADLAAYAEAHLRQHPEQMRFRQSYAELLADQSRSARALRALAPLTAEPEAARLAAQLHLSQGEPRRARRVLAHDDSAAAQLLRASSHLRQGRTDTAQHILASIDDPNFTPSAERLQARVVAREIGIDAASNYLDRILAEQNEPPFERHLAQLNLLVEYEARDRALMLTNAALARNPENPDLLYQRALVYADLNHLGPMERDLRRLIYLEPDNPRAFNALGYTLADQTARLDEAGLLLERALMLAPRNPYILDSWGWLQYRRGEYEQAVATLRDALNERLEAEIAAHLAIALWDAGEADEARRYAAVARRLIPSQPVEIPEFPNHADFH